MTRTKKVPSSKFEIVNFMLKIGELSCYMRDVFINLLWHFGGAVEIRDDSVGLRVVKWDKRTEASILWRSSDWFIRSRNSSRKASIFSMAEAWSRSSKFWAPGRVSDRRSMAPWHPETKMDSSRSSNVFCMLNLTDGTAKQDPPGVTTLFLNGASGVRIDRPGVLKLE